MRTSRNSAGSVPAGAGLAVLTALLITVGCGESAEVPAEDVRVEQPAAAEAPAAETPAAETPAETTPDRIASAEMTPAETVTEMLKAYLGQRLGEYYHYVATSEKQLKSLEDLQAEFAPSSADLVTEYLFSKTVFKIDSTHVESDSAFVFVTSRAPSIEYVLEQAAILESNLGSDVEMGMKLSILGERYKLAGAPVDEHRSVYPLVREPAGWRVIIGWAQAPGPRSADMDDGDD